MSSKLCLHGIQNWNIVCSLWLTTGQPSCLAFFNSSMQCVVSAHSRFTHFGEPVKIVICTISQICLIPSNRPQLYQTNSFNSFIHIWSLNRVGQSREIYSNSVPLSPPHWPYPKRIRPPSWPRVAVASSIQNTKLFTWRTWPGAGAVPKCDWAARSQCGFKQRRADHNKLDIHLICCDAWPIRYHYGTDDCMNMITRMTTSIISSVIVWKMTIYFFHTHT